MMSTAKRFLSAGLLALAFSACKKTTTETEKPDDTTSQTPPPGGSSTNPQEASAAAKTEFAAVAKQYQSAKADGSLSAQECEQLVNDFTKVYKTHGKSMLVARFNAAAVWDECGNFDKAEPIYQEVISAAPDYDLAYNNLGVIYWRKGQEKKALDTFRKGVEANKRQAKEVRNNIAGLARNVYASAASPEAFSEAETSVQTVLALDSNNREAYENLARLYYDRGVQKDKSYLVLANLVVTQAQRVFAQDGVESADIYNILGLLYMQRNDQVNALKAFKETVRIEPEHVDANLNIAFISIRFRDYAQAEKSVQVALRNPKQQQNVEAYLALGVARRGLKNLEGAEEAYKKAAEIDKQDPRPWYNLGVLYQEHKATQDNLDQEGIKAALNVAKKHYSQFLTLAGAKSEYKTQALDAKDRQATIDETFEVFTKMAELEKQAKALEELQKKQEEEERKRLLELEKKAMGGG